MKITHEVLMLGSCHCDFGAVFFGAFNGPCAFLFGISRVHHFLSPLCKAKYLAAAMSAHGNSHRRAGTGSDNEAASPAAAPRDEKKKKEFANMPVFTTQCISRRSATRRNIN